MEFGLLFEIQTANPFENDRERQVWHEAIEQAELADKVGFYSVWAVEHHFLVEYAHCSAPEVFLSAVSQRTQKVRLGHGVAIAPGPVNHPFRNAERIAALDIVSNGRVDAGFGRGFSDLEQRGFNMNPEETRDMALEVVSILPKIWADGEFEGFKGKFIDLPPRYVIPKPVQKPHPPMWWACTSPASYELAGKHGLGCLCFAFQPPEEISARIEVYRSEIAKLKGSVSNLNEKVAGYSVSLCLDNAKEARILGAKGFLFNLRRWIDYLKPLAVLPSHEWYKSLLDNPLLEALDQSGTASDDQYDSIGGTLTELGYCAFGGPEDCADIIKRFDALGIDQLLVLMQTAGIDSNKVTESISIYGDKLVK
jgi:alkanesulfonate monooxygenase SsuD/methylene tetrahydromethanopterin reductase-like flavin-dependent oxidoreductase (luciferase family)